ncbi:hypothetical protein ig2599ANME_0202 [groundwater metagenome]
MFNIEEVPEMKRTIRIQANADKKLLDDLRDEVHSIACEVRTIKICGSFSDEAPYSKDPDRINRIDRIDPFTNPVHPVQSGSSFSTAPDINCYEFIKICISQNSSPQSNYIFIRNTFSGLCTTLYTDRIKSSYVRGKCIQKSKR